MENVQRASKINTYTILFQWLELMNAEFCIEDCFNQSNYFEQNIKIEKKCSDEVLSL